MKGNIYEKWFFYVGKCRVSWLRKHGYLLGKKIEGIKTTWGVEKTIIKDDYYCSLHFGRLEFLFQRHCTEKDRELIIYNK